MNYPAELRYTKDHEWVKVEGSVATIGITEFAQSELGDIVFVELESEGTEVSKDDVFGTVEAVKTVSELFAPVAGSITALNEQLEATPEVVNEDPYGAGWMVKIEMSNPAEVDDLLTADAYAEMVG